MVGYSTIRALLVEAFDRFLCPGCLMYASACECKDNPLVRQIDMALGNIPVELEWKPWDELYSSIRGFTAKYLDVSLDVWPKPNAEDCWCWSANGEKRESGYCTTENDAKNAAIDAVRGIKNDS